MRGGSSGPSGTDDPLPDVKANGSEGPINLGTSDTLSVSISLTAGSSLGVDCDWWVAVAIPFGWYYFDVGTMLWVLAGSSYTDLSSTFQGPLFDLVTFTVLNMDGLPAGTYTFYFTVDTNRNGYLDLSQLYYDSVVVNIKP